MRNAYNSYGEYIGVNPSTIPLDVAARLLVKVDLAGGEGSVNVAVQVRRGVFSSNDIVVNTAV